MTSNYKAGALACGMFLLYGCSIDNGAPATRRGCMDTLTNEKISEIGDDIRNGEDAEGKRDEVVDLGDKTTLLPLQGTDSRCTVDPASWVQNCTFAMFRTLRHQRLTCRPIADGIELLRLATRGGPPTNTIVTIRVLNSQWNGPVRALVREGEDSVSRVSIFKNVTVENDEGIAENRCELDNKHVEVRGDYIFEKIVEFVVQNLFVSQPCTP